jgi:hypothetical protein
MQSETKLAMVARIRDDPTVRLAQDRLNRLPGRSRNIDMGGGCKTACRTSIGPLMTQMSASLHARSSSMESTLQALDGSARSAKKCT